MAAVTCDFAFSGSERIWERYSAEHPILSYIRRNKDGRAVKFSDFVSPRKFRGTSLYNEFFRPLGIRHQMHFLFQEPTSHLVGVALNRGHKDFSERERLILNLVRPHLEDWARAQLVQVLNKEGLPPPNKPYAVERGDTRLWVRLVVQPGYSMLLLGETRPGLDFSSLESLGLTRREVEILAWMTRGKTNAEIGTIVGTKSRTVEKHIERILQKLAVETRTAAAAVALDWLHQPPENFHRPQR